MTDFTVKGAEGERLFTISNIHLSLAKYENLLIGKTGLTGLVDKALSGNDIIYGRGDVGDSLFLYTGSGNDIVHGGLANETVDRGGYKGRLTFDGGAGEDKVSYLDISAHNGLNANLITGLVINPYGQTDRLSHVEDIEGTILDDIVIGSKATNVFLGSTGDDTLKGLDGNDRLAGSEGNDILIGGKGNDFLNGGEGGDVLSGGGGTDQIAFGGYGPDLTTTIVDLINPANNIGDAKGDVITSVEEFLFSNTTVGFVGTTAAEHVESIGGGDDSFVMGGGNDFVGVDGGGDTIKGGTGRDTVRIDGDASIDLETPANNSGAAAGTAFDNVEIFNLTGTTTAFSGDDKANVVVAGGGFGSRGMLDGRGGNDRLTGGGGGDDLTGGGGADQFIYIDRLDSLKLNDGGAALDVIKDFSHSDGDRIDLHAIDANGNTKGNQDFTFIGSQDFSGKAGELRFEKDGGDTYVYADTDGINGADFAIRIDGSINFAKADFML